MESARLAVVFRVIANAVNVGLTIDDLRKELLTRPWIEGHDVTRAEIEAVLSMTVREVQSRLAVSMKEWDD